MTVCCPSLVLRRFLLAVLVIAATGCSTTASERANIDAQAGAWRPPQARLPGGGRRVAAGQTAAALLSLLLVLCGCETPIGVQPADPIATHRELNSFVLTNGELSGFTNNALRLRGLDELVASDPARGLHALHNLAAADGL